MSDGVDECDRCAAVESFGKAFEHVEARETGGVDGPEFAGDAAGVGGRGDEAGYAPREKSVKPGVVRAGPRKVWPASWWWLEPPRLRVP